MSQLVPVHLVQLVQAMKAIQATKTAIGLLIRPARTAQQPPVSDQLYSPAAHPSTCIYMHSLSPVAISHLAQTRTSIFFNLVRCCWPLVRGFRPSGGIVFWTGSAPHSPVYPFPSPNPYACILVCAWLSKTGASE